MIIVCVVRCVDVVWCACVSPVCVCVYVFVCVCVCLCVCVHVAPVCIGAAVMYVWCGSTVSGVEWCAVCVLSGAWW